MKPKAAILYIPVLHMGYIQFIRKLPKETWVFVVSDEILQSLGDNFDYIRRKDALRAVHPSEMVSALRSQKLCDNEVFLLHNNLLKSLTEDQAQLQLYCPDEDVSRAVVETYFSNAQVEYLPIHVRWHRNNVAEEQAVKTHRTVTLASFDAELMELAEMEAERSLDWWRQVGAVLVPKEGDVLSAHNTHAPDAQTPYVFGDPRSIFKRGVRLDLSTAEHAEAIVIGEAARRGIETKGGTLYVTTFPCPTCAMLIARAGIARCYFSSGYAVLEGERVLKDKGIELVRIKKETP